MPCRPLQHHSYRSFLGITCLMQISTREEDFIIDTLELRGEMYILNEAFTDPSIVKVRQNAPRVCWKMQRVMFFFSNFTATQVTGIC